MENNNILKKTYKVLFYTYLIVIINAGILIDKPNTSVGDLIINIINIYNLLFLIIINKRMNGKNKELYEENYSKIILAGIIIVLITTTAIKYIIKDERIISMINDTLRIELLISLIISCAAYKIFTKTKKEDRLNEIENIILIIDKDENKKINIIKESIIISFIYMIMTFVILEMQKIIAFIALMIILLIGFSAG